MTDTSRRKSDAERLDAVVNVRLTAAEKAKLVEDAEIAGLSVSELVRRRYFNRPIVAKTSLVAINEMRRLGGLLRHVHNESGGAYSEQTFQLLTELRKAIKEMVK